MSVLRLVALFFALLSAPAQTRQAARITIERLEPCSGMSETECCEWTLRTAGFRAAGEHLNKLTIRAARLSCADKQALCTQAVCRGLATARRFSSGEVKSICGPDQNAIKQRCAKNELCAKCVADLSSLGYADAHPACHAVTYKKKAKPDGPKVIKLQKGDSDKDDTDSSRHVIKRREKLH